MKTKQNKSSSLEKLETVIILENVDMLNIKGGTGHEDRDDILIEE
jgi:hypothetical protein